MSKLFTDMRAGQLGDIENLSFPVLTTAYKRRLLLDASMAEDPDRRQEGMKVMEALESMIGRNRSVRLAAQPRVLSVGARM